MDRIPDVYVSFQKIIFRISVIGISRIVQDPADFFNIIVYIVFRNKEADRFL